MALGTSDKQRRFDDPVAVLGDRLKEGSIYRLLAEHGHEMFSDDYFADCYTNSPQGRPTVPARILATVMILQAFEGLSDREATDRLGFDLRWQAAAGVSVGAEAFHPTVLVGARNRLRASLRPRTPSPDCVPRSACSSSSWTRRPIPSRPRCALFLLATTTTRHRASRRM